MIKKEDISHVSLHIEDPKRKREVFNNVLYIFILQKKDKKFSETNKRQPHPHHLHNGIRKV